MAKYLKKAERKAQLKAVAIELFSEKGYGNTSVDDILEKINYSKGGFYNCYSSKGALLEDIFADAAEFRYKELKNYKQKASNQDKESFLIEALLDKILDTNPYKKMFINMVMDINNDAELLAIYQSNLTIYTNDFIEFCQREGFEEYIKISTEDFGIFINSLVLGANILEACDKDSYKEMLRTMIRAYFKEMELFDSNCHCEEPKATSQSYGF